MTFANRVFDYVTIVEDARQIFAGKFLASAVRMAEGMQGFQVFRAAPFKQLQNVVVVHQLRLARVNRVLAGCIDFVLRGLKRVDAF